MTAAIQGIYGILQYLDIFQSNNSYFKISGSFLNPGPFGGYLASALPISLGLFFDKIRKRGSESVKICIGRSSKEASSIYIYGVILTIQVIALVLSESRSAWIAVIISIVVFCFIVSKSRKKEKIFYLYTGAFMLFTLLFGARHLYEFKKDSADGRLFIWTVTSDIILDNPVFGVGFDGFKSHYMNAQKNRIRANSNSYVSNNIVDDVIYTFNEPLQFICENGIVGGALLFLFILYSFPNRHIFNKQTTIIAFCGCLSICIFSLFSYVSDSLPIILNLILYVSILGSNSREVYSFCCIRGNLLNNLYMLILFLVISIGSFKIFHFYQSVKAWNKANQIYMLGDYNYSLIYYEKAYVSFMKNGDFMAMYGKSLLSSNKFEQAINILKKAEDLKNSSVVQCALGDSFKALHNYNMAENAYLNASSMVPGRLYPYYLLLKLYEEKNDEISALHMAEFILTKSIKVDSQAIDQMLQEAKRIKSKFRT
ncbi:O-antigen ligase family protein [Sphingobacterium sp.]|uniref:O-antigen ligase family protein n=1 Tax=Sphingobacterium sp. TaxID=341027 RepID=UPI002586E559|nr:O-antigen ligase family protein [Sphingobacterium sp.]WET69014.1 MAG: O-antigen ligase family protein [Sphingobacterium sp.]